MEWKLIGPFPNEKETGPATVYPPEKSIDPQARYDGKAGKVGWKDYVTTNETGVVDLFEGIGKNVNATAYALVEFTSTSDQGVEIRLGCFTAFKLWVNGELLLDRGDAYTGMQLDHYRTGARLKGGKNFILVKSCIDEPPPPFGPKNWKFQLRVCDASGKAVLAVNRPEKKTTK
jgi:hypothetical protein